MNSWDRVKGYWATSWLIVAFVFAVSWTFLALVFILYDVVGANASSDWPATLGEITVSEESFSEEGGSQARVTYTYFVDDQRYESSRISYGSDFLPPGLQLTAERLTAFPAGKEVTVYYDPQYPATAVLYPGNAYCLDDYALRAIFPLVGIIFIAVFARKLEPTFPAIARLRNIGTGAKR